MRLLNFDLGRSVYPIEIHGLGRVWDLHNEAEFRGLSFDPFANTVGMEWYIGPDLPYSALKLLFSDVRTSQISHRDGEVPATEDYCLSYLAKVLPEQAGGNGFILKRDWGAEDPIHLLFEFRSARVVVIDSETVELIGIPKTI